MRQRRGQGGDRKIPSTGEWNGLLHVQAIKGRLLGAEKVQKDPCGARRQRHVVNATPWLPTLPPFERNSGYAVAIWAASSRPISLMEISRILYFWVLPLRVMGKASTNLT